MLQAADFVTESRWITASEGDVNAQNTWIAFRKDITLGSIPMKVEASIAAASKYWLWINGEMVVFEGQLKRGPTPKDTYYDKVDITPFLKEGNNEVAVLLWYFGKSGFSHNSSGKSGLLFSAQTIGLYSDSQWMSCIHPAYGTCGDPKPNGRLSESSIKYDGNKDLGEWQTGGIQSGFAASKEIGKAGSGPWNALVARPTPLWKDFGPKKGKYTTKRGTEEDTLVVALPYNMQMTPIIEVDDPEGGRAISIKSDHLFGGGEPNVWAQYITRPGRQKYESYGWFNGEHLYVTVPHGVKVKSV
ncbi:MAG: glycoside hydrolase, partial [Bacteroidaceae bacterium]|nr:glycoside hydrolase [Bacteroidaceae bacterium]